MPPGQKPSAHLARYWEENYGGFGRLLAMLRVQVTWATRVANRTPTFEPFRNHANLGVMSTASPVPGAGSLEAAQHLPRRLVDIEPEGGWPVYPFESPTTFLTHPIDYAWPADIVPGNGKTHAQKPPPRRVTVQPGSPTIESHPNNPIVLEVTPVDLTHQNPTPPEAAEKKAGPHEEAPLGDVFSELLNAGHSRNTSLIRSADVLPPGSLRPLGGLIRSRHDTQPAGMDAETFKGLQILLNKSFPEQGDIPKNCALVVVALSDKMSEFKHPKKEHPDQKGLFIFDHRLLVDVARGVKGALENAQLEMIGELLHYRQWITETESADRFEIERSVDLEKIASYARFPKETRQLIRAYLKSKDNPWDHVIIRDATDDSTTDVHYEAEIYRRVDAWMDTHGLAVLLGDKPELREDLVIHMDPFLSDYVTQLLHAETEAARRASTAPSAMSGQTPSATLVPGPASPPVAVAPAVRPTVTITSAGRRAWKIRIPILFSSIRPQWIGLLMAVVALLISVGKHSDANVASHAPSIQASFLPPGPWKPFPRLQMHPSAWFADRFAPKPQPVSETGVPSPSAIIDPQAGQGWEIVNETPDAIETPASPAVIPAPAVKSDDALPLPKTSVSPSAPISEAVLARSKNTLLELKRNLDLLKPAPSLNLLNDLSKQAAAKNVRQALAGYRAIAEKLLGLKNAADSVAREDKPTQKGIEQIREANRQLTNALEKLPASLAALKEQLRRAFPDFSAEIYELFDKSQIDLLQHDLSVNLQVERKVPGYPPTQGSVFGLGILETLMAGAKGIGRRSHVARRSVLQLSA